MKNERSLVYYLIITCLFCLFASSCSQKMETTSFTAMNTYMTVKAYGENSKLLVTTNYLIQQEVEWLELTLSTTIEGSDIYKINVSAENERTGFVESSVHPETAYLITRCRELYERTGGAFNPALYPLIKEWGFTTGEYKVPDDNTLKSLLKNVDYSGQKFTVWYSKYTVFEIKGDRVIIGVGKTVTAAVNKKNLQKIS